MKYFKNAQIAKQFNVSNTSVFRWIEGALENKNALQLIKVGSKYHITEIDENLKELRRLKEQGTKYKTQSTYEIIEPDEKFYSLFDPEETIEIINSLKAHRQIPVKYVFTHKGGQPWSNFANQIDKNNLNSKKSKSLGDLFVTISEYLDYYTKDFSEINIVNIGQGNLKVLENTLKQIDKKKKVFSYTGIDISQELLDLSEKAIHDTLPNSKINNFSIDIENSKIESILYTNKRSDSSINIIFFVGSIYGSISNKKRVLENIHSSMDENDILIISNLSLNKYTNIGYEHLLESPEFIQSITWLPKLIGFDVEKNLITGTYNSTTKRRDISLIMDKDVSVKFDFQGVERQTDFAKGDSIILWNHTFSESNAFNSEIIDAGFSSLAHFNDQRNTYIVHTCRLA